jgi:hypothetical protein
MNTKFKQPILNNIETFNFLCDNGNFIPCFCTNDIIENYIECCKKLKGQSVSNE